MKERFIKCKFYSLDLEGNPDFKMDLNYPKKLNKQFDIILATEIIEHIENPTSFLNFCFNHLKKNGRLILTTPNAVGIQYIRNQAWCCSGRKIEQHIHTFTMPMLELLLDRTGFRVIDTDYINAFWTTYNPLRYISGIIKSLRTDLLIVGEKRE